VKLIFLDSIPGAETSPKVTIFNTASAIEAGRVILLQADAKDRSPKV